MILDDIIEHKKIELQSSIQSLPLKEIEQQLSQLPDSKDFYKLATQSSGIKIIAEVKKASPSKGIIAREFDPVRIAKSYEDNGAFAISVLTDSKFFEGKLEYLSEIREAVQLPLLRKDFTIDPYHIFEARLYGADLVLLIVAVLDLTRIREYLDVTHSLGMNAVVEVHDSEELDTALEAGSKIIGINNRDLKTFEVDIKTTEDLYAQIPPDVVVISESGISNTADIKRLSDLGISTFLIGEHFMSSPDPGEMLGQFISRLDIN